MKPTLCGIVLLAATGASADTVVFDLVREYTGSQQPAGSLTATFTDVADGVELRLSASLVDEEFVSNWLFNLDPALGAGELQFMKIDASGSFRDPVIRTGLNEFGAAGDGSYDILFSFGLEPGERFDGDDEVVYKITSSEMISAASFDFYSVPSGGAGPLQTAAHVQGVGPAAAGSGWLADGCFADCDENGVIDFFDFLCFQDAFAAGDAYADCDASGVIDFFDFLCFQKAFETGCL